MNVRKAKLSELHADPKNPRAHNERNLSTIAESLKRFGQVEPLVVQKSTGRVIGGNGRLEVMKNDGAEEVEIVEVDVSDTDAKQLGLMLNRTAELASWDEDNLSAVIGELRLEDVNFEALGWDGAEMEGLTSRFEIPPGDHEAPELTSEDSDVYRMTFALTSDEKETVDRAVNKAKEEIDDAKFSENGAALNLICERYLGGIG
jgi:hypothetical protein